MTTITLARSPARPPVPQGLLLVFLQLSLTNLMNEITWPHAHTWLVDFLYSKEQEITMPVPDWTSGNHGPSVHGYGHVHGLARLNVHGYVTSQWKNSDVTMPGSRAFWKRTLRSVKQWNKLGTAVAKVFKVISPKLSDNCSLILCLKSPWQRTKRVAHAYSYFCLIFCHSRHKIRSCHMYLIRSYTNSSLL